MFFFFFQAEDGIRDGTVTGVQTCALPILHVVQDAERLSGGQVDADLFAGFADGRGAEIGVGGIAATAGERDLTRPRVAGALGAVDEQRLESPPFSTVVQQHGHRRGNHPRFERDRLSAVAAQRAPGFLQSYAEISSPPSTLMTFPVIQSAPGLHSATIAPPRSVGVVRRWCGFRWVAISTSFSFPGILRSAGVSVTPPRSAFTAIPSGASSSASWRQCDSSAALAADTAP